MATRIPARGSLLPEGAVEAFEVHDLRVRALSESIEALFAHFKEKGIVAHQGGVTGNQFCKFGGGTELAIRGAELAAAVQGAVIPDETGVPVASGFQFNLSSIKKIGGIFKRTFF